MLQRIIDVLEHLPTKDLKRIINSGKEYVYFKISVFNVGMSVQPICTNKYKSTGRNWNGYDFQLELDGDVIATIETIIKNR